MDQKLLDEFRALLLERREEIFRKARARGVKGDEEALSTDDRLDVMDLATSMTEQTLNTLFQDRERETLLQIERALRRIEEGEFGICEECDEPIGPGRLRAQPTTLLCVQCKEEEEKEQQRQTFQGH